MVVAAKVEPYCMHVGIRRLQSEVQGSSQALSAKRTHTSGLVSLGPVLTWILR